MRIRSIHPEFYRSEDIAALDWDTRLVFIGLWSYVDDNGVGRDVEKLIQGDLFALEEDPRETLAKVSRALATLSAGSQITRYTVDGKPYLHITAWTKWQKIDRPGKARYPAPTCDDAVIRDSLATVSRDPIDMSSPGEGEKGRRGEEEKTKTPATKVAEPDGFAAFWESYPRKVGRAAAAKAYRSALKKATADRIWSGLLAAIPGMVATEEKFRPHAATWLNQERWDDERAAPVQPLRPSLPYAHEIELAPDGMTPEESAAWDEAQRARWQR